MFRVSDRLVPMMHRTHAFWRHFLLLALLPALLPSLLPAAGPAGFVQTRGTQIVDAAGQPLLLRGISLGNWLVPEGYMWLFKRTEAARDIEAVIAQLVGDDAARRFWADWRERYITRADIRLIREAGFNSIRVPLHHRLFLSADDPSCLGGPGWSLLDRLIGWCKEEHLLVLLDLHAAPGGQTGTDIDDSPGYPFLFEDEASQDQTVTLWRGLATRYRDEKTVLGYELLNEPIAHHFDIQRLNPRLAPLYRRLVTAIREIDPHHVIFLGGAQWNTNLDAAGAPFAPNLVYTFHTYWTEPTVKTIERYLAFREKHQVPLYLGESGQNKDGWIRQFREVLEANDVGWCFWPYKKVAVTGTSVVTIPPPPEWNLIRTFAEHPRAKLDQIRQVRPDPAHAARILATLIAQLDLDRCQLNEGYVRALGLTPHPMPPAAKPAP